MSAVRTYRGIVRGSHVEFVGAPPLPDGTEVDVIVGNAAAVPSGRGSPAAIRAALARAPRATAEDVGGLLREIRAGRRPVSYRGMFDENTRP